MARNKLDALEFKNAEATARIRECVDVQSQMIALLLNELYMSQNSDIETKDKLYVIRETFRNRMTEIVETLDAELHENSNCIREAASAISNF